ncbi:MAG: murein biosynthesis integral membrane protein MurJ [bacterium]|nr:murein biosynthesis integral membrane protein MurJ [bacterium]
MEKKIILKNISKVAGSTLVSRIFGYCRDMAIAHFFGAGFVADAFYVAYRIPNLLRRLLGEGALVASFIPVYTDYLEHKSQEERQKFLNTVFSCLITILVCVTILGIIFAPFIVRLLAPGFVDDSEKVRLVIILTRVMFPFFVAVGSAALLMGILYAHHIFIYSALSSCFLSISQLGFIFFLCPRVERPILWLAMSVVLGGFLQAAFQLIPLLKKKINLNFTFDWKNTGLQKVGFLMIPAALGASVDQVSAFVDVIFASYLKEGSVSALYYANHLMLLPLALFGIAVSAVSLPVLSKSSAYENLEKLKSQLIDNLNIMTYFIIPSTIGLFVLATPIIRLLFERGQFGASATIMSSYALKFYALGVLAYASVKIVATAYYSLKDTKTPVKVAVFSVFCNIILNILLMKPLELGGLALATAISSGLNAILLLYFLSKKIGSLGIFNDLTNFFKIIMSGFCMGFIIDWASQICSFQKFFAVFVPIFIGAIFYFLITYFLKVKEITYIIKNIKTN